MSPNPCSAREGGSVELYDSKGELEVKDEVGFDTSTFFQRVYQQRADLPELTFAHGNKHLLTGLFVLNGVPCGLIRASRWDHYRKFKSICSDRSEGSLKQGRFWLMAVGFVVCIVIIWGISRAFDKKPSVLDKATTASAINMTGDKYGKSMLKCHGIIKFRKLRWGIYWMGIWFYCRTMNGSLTIKILLQGTKFGCLSYMQATMKTDSPREERCNPFAMETD